MAYFERTITVFNFHAKLTSESAASSSLCHYNQNFEEKWLSDCNIGTSCLSRLKVEHLVNLMV